MKKLIVILLIITIMTLFAFVTRVTTDIPECVKLTYHKVMICEWPIGHFTSYTAGWNNVVIAGADPNDKSWDGQYFRLEGYLVNNGSCTMLVVTKANNCSSVDVK